MGATVLATSLHHNEKCGGLMERVNCSSPMILDLCVKRMRRTPSPEGARYHQVPRSEPEMPSSTVPFPRPLSQTGSDTSESSDSHLYHSACNGMKIKATRPFKAYPKDPLSLAAGVATAEAILGRDSAEAYAEFRKRMLSQVQQNFGMTNKNMRRNNNNNASPHISDPAYWEKRRKNNEAAKRSRDARRAKEDEIAIRCAFLEQENIKLRYEVAALRDDNQRMRNMIYK